MVPSPCLHPLHITDSHGVKRTVPCGHCSACLVNKGRQRTERLEDYLSEYPYKFFVTLTYADENLPLALFDAENYCLYHTHDCDYNGVVYSRDLAECNGRDLDWLDNQMLMRKYG